MDKIAKHCAALLVALSLSVPAAQAQRIADVFVTMPRQLLPALTDVNRADLVDFIDNGMRAAVTNAFDSTVVMTQMNDTYLSLKTSATGTLQMKMLPLNDSTSIVCLARTVCPGACLSDVRFYTTGWEKLDGDTLFTMPPLAEFVTSNDSTFMADSVAHSSLADIDLYEVSLSPDSPSLTVRTTVADYATREEAERLRRWLKPQGVRMEWTGGRFTIAR